MNTTFNSRNTTARVAAFFAAAVVTTVLVGSQFGLAGHFEAEAGSVLAGQPATGPVATAMAKIPGQSSLR